MSSGLSRSASPAASLGGTTDRMMPALTISASLTATMPARSARLALAELRPSSEVTTRAPRSRRRWPMAAPISPGAMTAIRSDMHSLQRTILTGRNVAEPAHRRHRLRRRRAARSRGGLRECKAPRSHRKRREILAENKDHAVGPVAELVFLAGDRLDALAVAHEGIRQAPAVTVARAAIAQRFVADLAENLGGAVLHPEIDALVALELEFFLIPEQRHEIPCVCCRRHVRLGAADRRRPAACNYTTHRAARRAKGCPAPS